MLLKRLPLSKILTLAVTALLALTISGSAHAQPATACDPEYMDALEARAFLEAQREIAQNQNLILKADSVLEYTCFREALNALAGNGRNFSESLLWGAIIGQNPTSLDLVLTNVVWTSAMSYIMTNFSHSYLHNRSALDYAINPAVVGGAYTCSEMQQVWDAAQCLDFWDNTADQFYDFNWYQSNDPRRPILLGNCPLAPPKVNTHVPVAFNDQQALYLVTNEPVDDATRYINDPVVTYLNLILPVGGPAPAPANCGAVQPIPTGVCVDRINVNRYSDAVCPNPGCHFVPNTGNNCNPAGALGNCAP